MVLKIKKIYKDENIFNLFVFWRYPFIFIHRSHTLIKGREKRRDRRRKEKEHYTTRKALINSMYAVVTHVFQFHINSVNFQFRFCSTISFKASRVLRCIFNGLVWLILLYLFMQIKFVRIHTIAMEETLGSATTTINSSNIGFQVLSYFPFFHFLFSFFSLSLSLFL